MLKLGTNEWDIYRKGERRPGQSVPELRDRFRARQWLHQFKGNAVAMSALRRLLSGQSSLAWGMGSANDDLVIEQAAELLAAGLWHVHEGQLLSHQSNRQSVSADQAAGKGSAQADAKGNATGAESSSSRSGASTAKPAALRASPAPKQGKASPETEKKLTWVEIELVDDDGQPVPGVEYEIQLPDGSVKSGRLNDKGKARYDDIDPGQCQVRFPGLHANEWQRV